MTRILAGAAVIGGCLLATGCDTSPGSGSVGPQVSVPKNFTSKEDSQKAQSKTVQPKIQGGDSQPPKE
jgi:hypothetical protein